MQTLRKLPNERPNTAALKTSKTASAATPDLVQEDPGGHRDIERLGARGERNGDPHRGDVVEVRPDAGAFVADDHGHGATALAVERLVQRRAVGGGGPERDVVLARPRD